MEKIPYIIHSALSNYGEIGIALGVAIFVLFIVEISLHLGLYGRIASFRLTNRKQTRDEEPAISLVIPLFAEDSNYLDTTLVSMLTLESTMLTTFSEGTMTVMEQKIMLGATGGVISALIVATAIYMIVIGTKKLKQLKSEVENG